MKYDEIAGAYLVPPDIEIASPIVPESPARRLRDVLEPIATIGWWSRAAGEQFDAVDLDFLGGYVWGRAASLGPDVTLAVVASAFGVFDPSILEAGISSARQVASSERILASRAIGASAGLAAATPHISAADIERPTRRLRSALDTVDGTARPLFSALRALPIPDDPYGGLWRAAEMYREHRGDGHLAVCVAAGLDAVEMNVLTEVWLDYPVGEYSSTRGFGGDRIDGAVDSLAARGWIDPANRAITTEGRAARDRIEAATDRTQTAVIDAIGHGVDELVDELQPIADAVLDAHAAPADARKRAAG